MSSPKQRRAQCQPVRELYLYQRIRKRTPKTITGTHGHAKDGGQGGSDLDQGGGGAKAGVSNERFSAKVNL